MAKRILQFAGAVVLSTAITFAQTDSRGVTITALQSISLANTQKPDQAIFAVDLASPLNTSLDDAVSALAGSGIASSDLSNVQTLEIQNLDGSQNCVPMLEWNFTLTVPISKVSDTITLLTGVQQRVAQKSPGSMMDFRLQGYQVSAESARSQQCSVSDLIAAARAQAQTLANAARATLGPVIAMSDTLLEGVGAGSTAGSLGLANISQSAQYCNSFGGSGTTTGTTATGVSFGIGPVGFAVTCSVVVKFSLLPSQ